MLQDQSPCLLKMKKCILDMADVKAVIGMVFHGHHIKAQIAVMLVCGQVIFRCLLEKSLLARVNGFFRLAMGMAPPRFYFHENQRIFLLRNNVHLLAAIAPVAVKDAVTAVFQVARRNLLTMRSQ